MRFVCFHGMRSNGTVFKRQTARIRQALGDEHSYVFLNGAIPDAPDGIQDSRHGCYRFLGADAAQYKALYSEICSIIERTGPFDGVMGFSEGGLIAAALLIHDRKHPVYHFKCGIFFSAATPGSIEQLLYDGSQRILDSTIDGVLVDVPTAHIWSDSGDRFPGMGENVAKLCKKSLREEIVHHLNHEIPGSGADDDMNGVVRAIERTIERAKNWD